MNETYWEDKINVFIALAPVTRLKNGRSKLLNLIGKFSS